MKQIKTFLTCLVLILGVSLVGFVPGMAATNEEALCQGAGGTWKKDSELPNGGSCDNGGRTVMGTIQQLTDVLIFLIGAIAVIMIIIGGIRYTLSAGDQTALASAKNTILYAIVGLIVAIMAYAIVHFIFTAFNIK